MKNSKDIIEKGNLNYYIKYRSEVGFNSNFGVYVDIDYCMKFNSFDILEYIIKDCSEGMVTFVYEGIIINSLRHNKMSYFYRYFPLCGSISHFSRSCSSDIYREITDFLMNDYFEITITKKEKLKFAMFLKSFNLSKDLGKFVDTYLEANTL
jgi:hypothetical protein